MHLNKKKTQFIFHHIYTYIFLAARIISVQIENAEHLNKAWCNNLPLRRDRTELHVPT